LDHKDVYPRLSLAKKAGLGREQLKLEVVRRKETGVFSFEWFDRFCVSL
jgi:hypothetical protein